VTASTVSLEALLRSEGKGILTIARTIGVGTSTVQRALEASVRPPG